MTADPGGLVEGLWSSSYHTMSHLGQGSYSFVGRMPEDLCVELKWYTIISAKSAL